MMTKFRLLLVGSIAGQTSIVVEPIAKGACMTESASRSDRLAAAMAELCALFVRIDRDAWGWAFQFPDESDWDSPDCDVMSRRFLRLAGANGWAGFLVRAECQDDDWHWFAVVTEPEEPAVGLAVDWTARQFYNLGRTGASTDVRRIACPLLFEWPGRYPLGNVSFESMTPVA